MKKEKIIRINRMFWCLLLPFYTVFAQTNNTPPEPFNDDTQDTFPINNYLIIALFIAIYMAYQYIKTQPKKNKIQ